MLPHANKSGTQAPPSLDMLPFFTGWGDSHLENHDRQSPWQSDWWGHRSSGLPNGQARSRGPHPRCHLIAAQLEKSAMLQYHHSHWAVTVRLSSKGFCLFTVLLVGCCYVYYHTRIYILLCVQLVSQAALRGAHLVSQLKILRNGPVLDGIIGVASCVFVQLVDKEAG